MSIEDFLRAMKEIKKDFSNDIESLAMTYENRLMDTLGKFVGDVDLGDSKVPMERSR